MKLGHPILLAMVVAGCVSAPTTTEDAADPTTVVQAWQGSIRPGAAACGLPQVECVSYEPFVNDHRFSFSLNITLHTALITVEWEPQRASELPQELRVEFFADPRGDHQLLGFAQGPSPLLLSLTDQSVEVETPLLIFVTDTETDTPVVVTGGAYQDFGVTAVFS
jgi:hypothetical protein